ncbi:GNAT family N-acetyltransferase [Tessaracoccus flavus]|uniref:GNAT family N-acetyltransferase n=1 Tax=Tessaracoccus flavus TaxID=1610493 RepID=UPI00089B987C|nr:GNAT family N-acetyltransferase [Tessaracoccus flavus]SDZ12333.1 Acetyltransferase (GNAT) domain-containing protein [Tessaracoccus flavus]
MAHIKAADLEVRRATPDDDGEVIPLLQAALKKDEDPHYRAFLEWKHRQNPFGVSPAWVALHEGRIVGYRTLLRWRFINDEGKKVTAVRAVDTATHPDFQGLGIFRLLTVRGVAELTMEGDGIVFNTPNDQSRPGYLKMGWSEVKRLPIGVLPSGTKAMVRMVSSRVPAALWSEDTTVGIAGSELADPNLANALLAHAPKRGFRTDRTPEYLAWRTALGPLKYRILLADERAPEKGGVIFRLKRRGSTVEAAIVEQLVPNARVGAKLVWDVVNRTKADYAIGLRTGPSAGLIPVPVPGMGPLLTTRPLAASPPPPSLWTLTLADVELF